MLQPPRRLIAAALLSISEGGLGLVTTARAEQGEPIRLRFPAQGALPETEFEALVWYDRPGPRSNGRKAQHFLGCVIPDRDPSFLALLAEVERRHGPPPETPRRTPRAARPARAKDPAPPEEDLPRSRDPLPPPKPEPEETLPRFRVRLRQVGGPRTRNVTLRACSVVQAAERARADLAAAGDADRWAVLEVRPCDDATADG